MKKTLCVVVAFAMITVIANAQNVNFGVKAGYNSSSVEITNAGSWTSKSGFHVGALAHIHASSHFAVQPEITFSTQGGESPTEKLKLDYFNVPVLLQYMVSDGFRIETGPQVGFLVSAKEKAGDNEADIKDLFKGIDFSWDFGLGYVFSSGLGIDARYNLGLSDIADNPNIDIKAKNRVFQVGLFYQFMNNSGKKK
jgi:hypothetical protein